MIIKENLIKILYSEQEIQNSIKALGKKINEHYKGEELYLLCVLKGSVMFMVDLAKTLKMPVKMEFIRLSSYGNAKKSSGFVKKIDFTLPDLNNKNVMIVEDIIDTGHTAKFLVEELNSKYKMNSLKFCALLNKKCKREVDIDADFYCFETDDRFLIGYGLDYEGLYRNIPYIGFVEPDALV